MNWQRALLTPTNLLRLLALGSCFTLLVVFAMPQEQAQAKGTRRCRLPIKAATWRQRVRATADTTSMARAFRRQGYRVPRRGYLLGAQIVAGVGQPAFRYMALSKASFAPSQRHYWPASTIKLWAAVGALQRLHHHGLDGDAWLHFSDAVGRFAGQPKTLAKTMDNVAYDRLLRIATLQLLNGSHRRRLNFQHTYLRRGYGGSGSLRRSPRIPYLQGGHRGTLPASRFAPRALPCRKNCTSLFEIQDVLRRVVLHERLPTGQRLLIARRDIKRLRTSLRGQWKWIKSAVQRQLGKQAVIYNKAGSVPGNHLLDNTAIIAPQGRFLLTVASPWPRRQTSVAPALRRLNELARQGLWQLQRAPQGPLAQSDAGPSLAPRISLSPRRKRISLRLRLPKQGVDHAKAWYGRVPIKMTKKAGRYVSRWHKYPTKAATLTVQGYHKGQLVSYHSFALPTAPKWRTTCR